MNWKNLSFLALAGLIACIYSLLLNRSLFGTGPVTIGVQILALALMIWARITFGMRSFHAGANPTSGGLVTTGPYRFIRHPIYAAIVYFLWAAVAAHVSAATVAAGLLATAMNFVRIIGEEKLLAGRYPEYAEYSRKTARLVPYLF